MNTRYGRNERGRSRERSPLRPQRYAAPYYGCVSQVPPRPSGQQSPPPYSPTPNPSEEEHKPEEINCNGCSCWTFILLIAVVFVSVHLLPAKINKYVDAVTQMRVQQDALKEEANHLEKERLALREERERWEKARDEKDIPQGAFWEGVWPRWECLAYGKREYWGILRNIPPNRTDVDACMNMPVEIKGVTVRRPERCQYVEGSPYIHGFWMVDWDQSDCKPWHQGFHDNGCTNLGSGIRRIEAAVVGINKKGQQDWRVMCETTPMTWDHITYHTPTHCDERSFGWKVAMWDIPDLHC